MPQNGAVLYSYSGGYLFLQEGFEDCFEAFNSVLGYRLLEKRLHLVIKNINNLRIQQDPFRQDPALGVESVH